MADAGAAEQRLMLTKGGSFLCHRSYCYRYRIAARTGKRYRQRDVPHRLPGRFELT